MKKESFCIHCLREQFVKIIISSVKINIHAQVCFKIVAFTVTYRLGLAKIYIGLHCISLAKIFKIVAFTVLVLCQVLPLLFPPVNPISDYRPLHTYFDQSMMFVCNMRKKLVKSINNKAKMHEVLSVWNSGVGIEMD